MSSNPPGITPPPKPWERVGSASGPAPFKPPSPGSTSDIVEASGTAKPGEVVSNAGITAPSASIVTRPLPARPWEQNYGSSYGGYGSNMSYNSGYGSGMYGSSSYGGLGGSYGGGGLYGNSMYRGGYGGGLYGGGSSMYGGTMNNSGFGGQMGAYGMSGPYGNQDPNDPYGAPSSPPGFWMSFLRVMHGVVNVFGRISMLIDQNTQAFHMFMSALLQVCLSVSQAFGCNYFIDITFLKMCSWPFYNGMSPPVVETLFRLCFNHDPCGLEDSYGLTIGEIVELGFEEVSKSERCGSQDNCFILAEEQQ